MKDYRIPHGLYEALPYFYVLIGAASIIGSSNMLGHVSGAMLISAGLVIRHLRIQYRRAELLTRASQLELPSEH